VPIERWPLKVVGQFLDVAKLRFAALVRVVDDQLLDVALVKLIEQPGPEIIPMQTWHDAKLTRELLPEVAYAGLILVWGPHRDDRHSDPPIPKLLARKAAQQLADRSGLPRAG